ncbi:MAG: hypothetical protein J6U67_09115, partial [Lachnospiraceae bacterium]|nr:hypothetical protein [Lachnospiraceae bacterium]
VEDDKIYSVGLQDYHLRNLKNSFDLEIEEIDKNQKHRAVATSAAQVLEEMLALVNHRDSKIEGRIKLHLTDEAIKALMESGR